jgi:two-component system chemotaxis response regulator CheY
VARILIVDDNLLIRSLLRQTLESGGHEVIGAAKDGAEAIGAYTAYVPDLVTVDLVMPDQDGLEILAQMRAIDPRPRVIICSAHLTERKVIAALKLGAQEFIRKPFQHQGVLDTVADVLGDRGRAGLATRAPAPADPGPGDDRREFARVDIEIPLVLTPDGAAPVAASTIDISGGGMQVSAPALVPDTSVSFRLDLGPGAEPIDGRARVVRSAGEGRQALIFEHLSITDHERLIGYIRQRQPMADLGPG